MARPFAVAAGVWPAVFVLALLSHQLTNDHFHRISSARQIAVYGELPFRDFFDPGFLLTELSSAAVLRLAGDSTVGETLLNSAFIATGLVLVMLLARRMSASWALGIAAAFLALLAAPRAYDYDKVLFYPLGLLACWRYADRRRAIDVAVLAAVITVAGLFRYDNGLFIGVAALVTMAMTHAGDWRRLLTRLLQLAAGCAVLLAPVAWFLSRAGGLGNAADQMLTYGVREGARTRMLAAPPLSLDTLAGYYLVIAVPIVSAVVIVLRRDASERAHVWSAVALCVLLDLFILRDPVMARVGGVAGPPAILAAWLAGRVWPVPRVVRVAAGTMAVAAVVIVAAESWNPFGADSRLKTDRIASLLRERARTPARVEDLPSEIRGLVAYLRACTAPDDRVLAAWFAPEVYFYAQRGFAAGMAVTFGGHWSEPRFQQRSVERLSSQRAPIVIVRTGSDLLATDYPMLDAYVRERYRLVGESDFGDGSAGANRYRVFERADREPCTVTP